MRVLVSIQFFRGIVRFAQANFTAASKVSNTAGLVLKVVLTLSLTFQTPTGRIYPG